MVAPFLPPRQPAGPGSVRTIWWTPSWCESSFRAGVTAPARFSRRGVKEALKEREMLARAALAWDQNGASVPPRAGMVMRRVRLKIFGGFQARLEPGLQITLPTRKAQALLAYLALRPD